MTIRASPALRGENRVVLGEHPGSKRAALDDAEAAAVLGVPISIGLVALHGVPDRGRHRVVPTWPFRGVDVETLRLGQTTGQVPSTSPEGRERTVSDSQVPRPRGVAGIMSRAQRVSQS